MLSKAQLNRKILADANKLIQEVNREGKIYHINLPVMDEFHDDVEPANVACMKFFSSINGGASVKSISNKSSIEDCINRLEYKFDKAQKMFDLANFEMKSVERALKKHNREPKVVELFPNFPVQTKIELKLLEIVLRNSSEAVSFMTKLFDEMFIESTNFIVFLRSCLRKILNVSLLNLTYTKSKVTPRHCIIMKNTKIMQILMATAHKYYPDVPIKYVADIIQRHMKSGNRYRSDYLRKKRRKLEREQQNTNINDDDKEQKDKSNSSSDGEDMENDHELYESDNDMSVKDADDDDIIVKDEDNAVEDVGNYIVIQNVEHGFIDGIEFKTENITFEMKQWDDQEDSNSNKK